MKDTQPSAVISPFLSDHLIGMTGTELANAIQFPRETANLAALVSASHAVGSVYTVCYPDGDIQPIPLYSIAEQPSGTGKSRLVNMLYRGYIEQGAKLNKEIIERRENLKKDIARDIKSGQPIHENKAKELENLIEIPRGTTDATPQSLEKVMDRNRGFFMVYGTEQNLTKTLLGGLYSDGQTVDGIINSSFNGEYSSTERASADRITFQGRPFGGIFCLSQEGAIQTILDSAGSSGLAERFLMIREDDLLGYRGKYGDIDDQTLNDILCNKIAAPKSMTNRAVKAPPMKAYAQYRSKMERLAIERSSLEDVELSGLRRLKFKPEAWAMIEAAKEAYEREIGRQQVRNSFIASMNSKIDILVMKCAATIHIMDCADYQEIGDIGRDSVFTAFATVSALFNGIKKIADGNGLYGDSAETEYLVEYLSGQRRTQTMDEIVRNIKRRKDSPFKFYTKRGEAVEKIRECIARSSAEGKIIEDRRRQPPVFSV